VPRSDAAFESDVPLAPLTWFKIGGPVELLARPRTPNELSQLMKRSHGEGAPLRVIGGGSNILVSDAGVRGTVVALTATPFKTLVRTGEETMQCGAGARLTRLVNSLADWGLSGGEGITGVPGTLGGALRSNAGTSAGEVGQIVKRVWALKPDGEEVSLSGPECEFAYRQSALGEFVILGAALLAKRSQPDEIRAKMSEITAHRAATQPRGVRSAGCIFKNPVGTTAGRLLDELGLKGMTRGEARVSPVHANFIEAGKGATANDVKALIDEMGRRAAEERGVTMELQIELWGFDS
jgi:UDP-N-acetylmuramate dehydrogenase